ncbi:MAG: alcohol dehydrogenase catalytic domain-containing protein [Nitrososphaerota archaeon]|nr:alcohol dehydrogenase catalytic domain-containing protein [Nitrososphaerota archaeon]
MKAMRLYHTAMIETKPLVMDDIEVPSPRYDEVLLKVISCGVCHSNLHVIEGDWLSYGVPAKLPIIPGHEIIGTVVEVGSGVKSFRKGDLAGVQPQWKACGKCDYCISGRENLCSDVEILGETMDGGYCEYILAKENYTYVVPTNIDPELSAPLFCPGITAYRASKQANLAPGKDAYILGIGGVWHMAIQTSKLFGANIYAISTSLRHTELAASVGADETIVTSKLYDNLEKHYKKADSVIVFAPSQYAVDAAMKLVKKGGTVVIGVHANINEFQFFDEVTVKGTVTGTRSDMREVLRLASQGKISVRAKKFKLSKANEVLELLKNGRINGRAVLVP